MKRYVVVDADGFVENVILWDGVTPFSAPGSLVTESKCKAKRRPEPAPQVEAVPDEPIK